MRNKSFIVAGNRSSILRYMHEQTLEIVHVIVVENSFLHRYVTENNHFSYSILKNRSQIFDIVNQFQSDYFIANGLPFILPISDMRKNVKTEFVNIHPSFLPDLRGADPVPASILFKRDSGATCHYMDDGIDTGQIISQIKIPYKEEYDVGLLYKLCFDAEVRVFKKALENKFEVKAKQVNSENCIYYSFRPKDLILTDNDDNDVFLRKVKAFSNPSKGVYLILRNTKLKLFHAVKVDSEYINKFYNIDEDNILLEYEDKILFSRKNEVFMTCKYEYTNEL